jgi:hypothetical protein
MAAKKKQDPETVRQIQQAYHALKRLRGEVDSVMRELGALLPKVDPNRKPMPVIDPRTGKPFRKNLKYGAGRNK